MRIGGTIAGRQLRRAGGGADGRRLADLAEDMIKRLTCILSILLPRSIAAASPTEAALRRCSTVRKKLTN
jgi:hypothetical protein